MNNNFKDFKDFEHTPSENNRPDEPMDHSPQDTCTALPAEEVPSVQQEGVAEENFKDKWLRALAEHENLRRRLEKEKEDQVKYSVFRFAKEIVGIADNLSRALESVSPSLASEEKIEPFYKGVGMTLDEIFRIFALFGIEKVEALGLPFDPHSHQVMFEKEDEDVPPFTVVDVLQDGYLLHGRLLRPALVGVSKKPTPSQEA